MTNKAATFVGQIDFICYSCDYCVSMVYVEYCGSVIVVSEYCEVVFDVL